MHLMQIKRDVARKATAKFKRQGAFGALSCCACALLLTACSGGSPNKQATQTLSPPQQATMEIVQKDKAPTSIDILKSFSPAQGLNTTRLFLQPIKNNDERMQRLETTVQNIKDDFDTVTPAVVRLVAIEKDIKGLISQLEVLVKEEENRPTAQILSNATPIQHGMNAVPHSSPTLLHDAQQQVNSLPQHNGGHKSSMTIEPAKKKKQHVDNGPYVTVKKLRIGEHVDKTRIVLDLSGDAKFSTRMADNGRSFVLKISNADWTAQRRWVSEYAPLIDSYQVTQMDDYTRVVFDLKYDSRIILKRILKPSHGNGYRILLDVQSSEVHLP